MAAPAMHLSCTPRTAEKCIGTEPQEIHPPQQWPKTINPAPDSDDYNTFVDFFGIADATSTRSTRTTTSTTTELPTSRRPWTRLRLERAPTPKAVPGYVGGAGLPDCTLRSSLRSSRSVRVLWVCDLCCQQCIPHDLSPPVSAACAHTPTREVTLEALGSGGLDSSSARCRRVGDGLATGLRRVDDGLATGWRRVGDGLVTI